MANEGNPVVNVFMRHHSLGLLFVTLLWIGIVVPVIYYSGRKFAMIVATSIVIGNSWGTATWIYPYSFCGMIALFILNSSVLVFCSEKASASRE